MWQRLRGKIAQPAIGDGLAKTRTRLRDGLSGLLAAGELSEDAWAELEAALVTADVGLPATEELIADLKTQARQGKLRRTEELPQALLSAMARTLAPPSNTSSAPTSPPVVADRPYVVLVVGVNGSGKTTTVAKLGRWYQRHGHAVLLVAADTYRAAATEQLRNWADRLELPLAFGQARADPGAVVYDALRSRAGSAAAAVIVDTADRLHTQQNLMAELRKVRKVVERSVPGAPDETLLVMDATTGQNGLSQARAFEDAVGVTGLVLAKLDSSSRGGVAFAIHRELGLPIRFVGVGEQAEDLLPFDAARYVAALLGEKAETAAPQG